MIEVQSSTVIWRWESSIYSLVVYASQYKIQDKGRGCHKRSRYQFSTFFGDTVSFATTCHEITVVHHSGPFAISRGVRSVKHSTEVLVD